MSTSDQFTAAIIEDLTATIASGQTKSDSVDTYGVTAVLVQLPAAFTGTAITFEVSSDNVNFQPYYNIDDDIVTVTCTQGRSYGLAAQDFFPVRFIKLVSNSAEAAERVIKLSPKSI